MKSTISKLLAAIVVISMVAPLFGVAPVLATAEAPPTFEQVGVDSVVEMGKEGTYIVLLEDAPLATYTGGITGLAATSPTATGASKLDAQSPASVAYLDYLAAQQAQFIADAGKLLGSAVDVIYQYAAVLNGMAVNVSAADAEKLSAMPGVVAVERDFDRQINTDAGPAWLGAPGAWDGSETNGVAVKGEGIIVGVIDTGINLGHPSFAEEGPADGYVHTNPLGDGVFLGACATEPMTYTCNNKLIGAYDYVDVRGNESDGPLDQHSHGSHTSSTSAGNLLEDYDATLENGYVFSPTISGMAPHANIISYDACDTNGCPNFATNAAIDQAVMDGVDVINYSIGGGPTDPWQDSNSQAYLAARAAGVFVATSAGNDGPAPGTAGSPGNSPWMLTVGNATHNRVYRNALEDLTGGDTPPADIVGKGMTEGYGPAEIVYAGWYSDAFTESQTIPEGTFTPVELAEMCLVPFPADTFDGEIVVCDRGHIARVAKGQHVLDGGAGGYVLANSAASGASLVGDAHYLPGVHISYADGVTLKDWLTNTVVQTATISGAWADVADTNGDNVASGSSRGPNLPVLDVIKPNVIAPGTDVLAAYRSGLDIGFMSGTSMASPHVAGAGILVAEAHPDWTPAEIQSALESTAISALAVKEDGVTPADPFDSGAGRIYVSNAIKAGFVLDVTEAEYTDADPLAGGDPSTLNLTVLGQDQCLVSCSWVRELKSTMTETVNWTGATTDAAITVEPSSFALPAGGTQVVTVTADVSGMAYDEWFFGEVEFTPDNATTVPGHFTMAAMPSVGILPEAVVIETRRDAGAKMLMDLAVAESPELTIESFGLIPATSVSGYVPQHPNTDVDFPQIFFGYDEVFVTSVDVPAGAKRLVAAVNYTWSPDVDMLVLPDTDGDGVPEYADLTGEECQSAAGGSMEACDIVSPSAGTWFVMVLNFEQTTWSDEDGDYLSLDLAIVDGTDAGNMTFTHPVSATEAVPFDVTLGWDEEAMMSGQTWYGAFSVGTDAANPGNIMSVIPVNIDRLTDNVTKNASGVEDGGAVTVTYTLVVQPNVTGEEYTLWLTDTIPSGMTYVDGSVTGGAVVSGNQVTWSGVLDADYKYEMTDNTTDPACTTPFGGYIDWLTAYNFPTNPDISGDTVAWTSFSDYGGFEYYGTHYDMGLSYTDDGFALLDISNWQAAPEPWTNQELPDSELPNNVIAPLWQDMEIVYDEATNKGVTTVGNGSVAIIEFDDIQPYNGDGSVHYDMEVIMWTSAGPGPEIMFAYDNVVGPVDDATVGVENEDGTLATQYAYMEANNIADGSIICFDYVGPEPHYITYQVTIDDPTTVNAPANPAESDFTSTVETSTDQLGSKPETTAPTTVKSGYAPEITKSVYPDHISAHGDIVTYTIQMYNPNIYPLEGVTMTDKLPPLVTFQDWVWQPMGATFTAPDMITWTGTLYAESWTSPSFTVKTTEDTNSILVDVVNTAYMGYEGEEYPASVSFSLIRDIYLPLVFRNY